MFSGDFTKWDSENRLCSHYCPYTPFMFAFVAIIILWIWLPFAIILGCCAGLDGRNGGGGDFKVGYGYGGGFGGGDGGGCGGDGGC